MSRDRPWFLEQHPGKPLGRIKCLVYVGSCRLSWAALPWYSDKTASEKCVVLQYKGNPGAFYGLVWQFLKVLRKENEAIKQIGFC